MASEGDKKPVWQILTRPQGMGDHPWEPRRVHANSLHHAEAMLRRQGYKTDMRNAARIFAEDDDGTYVPPPIRCSKCGYSLEGSVISGSATRCPECGFEQPLSVLRTGDPANKSAVTGCVVWILGLLALLIVGVVALVFLADLLPYFGWI